MSDNDFPKLDGGWCDGMGCGERLCWCGEYLAMCEEFQRTYNKPWDKNDIDCLRVERIWRFGTERFGEYYKNKQLRGGEVWSISPVS